MVIIDDWRDSIPVARLGDPHAADRVVGLLLEWTHRKMYAHTGSDKEDVSSSFVEHMIRDQFAYLAAVEPCRLAGYLGQSLRHFIINWRDRADRRHSWEILWTDWLKGEEEDEEDPGMDVLLGTALNPEVIIVLREEIAALRAEVTRLTPRNQRIFALLIDEGLTEAEIATRLGMKAATVRSHVRDIRRHLTKWRQAREE
jgi:RNA polymerase sigma factor (sigma-70 family)